MKNAYITVLTTENYLPGIIVVNQSLKMAGVTIPHFTCCTDNIPTRVIQALNELGIGTIHIDRIEVDKHDKSLTWPTQWKNTFSKLNVFNLVQFEKIVFLDADMLTC